MRIYLIDDDEVSNFLFEGILTKADPAAVVRAFQSGQEALEVMEVDGASEYPALMFVDLSMPIMDGWEFLKELGQRHPQLNSKVYILTSSIREADEARSKVHPLVTGFLQKPLSQEELMPILGIPHLKESSN